MTPSYASPAPFGRGRGRGRVSAASSVSPLFATPSPLTATPPGYENYDSLSQYGYGQPPGYEGYDENYGAFSQQTSDAASASIIFFVFTKISEYEYHEILLHRSKNMFGFMAMNDSSKGVLISRILLVFL